MNIGDKYERLVVIERPKRITKLSKNGNKYTSTTVKVRCLCGREKDVSIKGLTRGDIKSCGCLHIEGLQARKTHGRSKTREYKIWTLMKNRCYNEKCPEYSRYGGRGIKMDESWKRSFSDFLIDMGLSPSTKHSIDRINNDGDYEPWNCRWATPIIQANNNSKNIMLTVDSVTMPIGMWAISSGIKRTTIWSRIRYFGWSHKEAVTIKPSPSNRLHNRLTSGQ